LWGWIRLELSVWELNLLYRLSKWEEYWVAVEWMERESVEEKRTSTVCWRNLDCAPGHRPVPAGHFFWPLMAKKNKALNGRNGREIIEMASPMAIF
jgi:hypothetical protein